jgi:hypothetical protein
MKKITLKFLLIMEQLMETIKCPCCDAEMQRISLDKRRAGGDGYMTPYEYKYTEEYVCCECGECVTLEEVDF